MDLEPEIMFQELKQYMELPLGTLFTAQKIMRNFLLMVAIIFLIWAAEMTEFPMQAAIQKITLLL